MKRILSALLVCLLLVLTLAACGSDTILFNDIKFSKYVDLGEYEGIEVDKSSDLLKGYYKDELMGDVSSKNLYVKKTEGKVQNGDTVYIDYVGKKDGVAFDGGTAENYPLTIGSGSFIEGFEEGLIGVEIGSTVDLNLTFPENYGNEELNGADVVFTVTVHYVSTTEERKPEEYYSDIGFKTLKEYEEDVWERAIKMYLLEKLIEESEIKDYPEEDIEYIYSVKEEALNKSLQNQYGVDLKTYLTAYGSNLEDYKKSVIEDDIKPDMEISLLLYYIVDKENIKITAEMVDEKIATEAKIISDEEDFKQRLIDYYGEYYFELMLVKEKALNAMYDSAKIK